MKKKINKVVAAITLVTVMTGCNKNSIADDAIKQGKLAMASLEYEKALNSFNLAIEEGLKEEEINQLISSINIYLEAAKAWDDGNYEETLSLLDGVTEVEPVSFQKDIELLRKKASSEQKRKEELEKEEAERLEAEKLAAEQAAELERQEIEEQKKIESIIDKIYEVTRSNKKDTGYYYEEKGYMTDDMVKDYYCFSIDYDGYMADNNIIVDKETLEMFTYDPYSGKEPLVKTDNQSIKQEVTEEEAVELVREAMKQEGSDEVQLISCYADWCELYYVEAILEERPYSMYTVNPKNGEVIKEY